jgi:hypothetical protein
MLASPRSELTEMLAIIETWPRTVCLNNKRNRAGVKMGVVSFVDSLKLDAQPVDVFNGRFEFEPPVRAKLQNRRPSAHLRNLNSPKKFLVRRGISIRFRRKSMRDLDAYNKLSEC